MKQLCAVCIMGMSDYNCPVWYEVANQKGIIENTSIGEKAHDLVRLIERIDSGDHPTLAPEGRWRAGAGDIIPLYAASVFGGTALCVEHMLAAKANPPARRVMW
jgi:hypothetical protein